MKKALTIALAASLFTFSAQPSQAQDKVKLIEGSARILKRVLTQAKAKQWKAACSSYKEHIAYKQRHNLFDYIPVTGTGRVRELQLKQNKLTSEANGLVNSNGKDICSKAGMSWVNVALPTPPSSVRTSSSVSSNIRSHCEREWGTNYRMVKYCVDQQTKAANALGY